MIECPICAENKRHGVAVELDEIAHKCMECRKELSQKKFYCHREGTQEHFCSKNCLNKSLLAMGRMVTIEVREKEWKYLNGTKVWGYEKRFLKKGD